MNGTFKIGDVVTLKSGGHRMTISGFLDGRFFCKWSHGHDVKAWGFDPAELTLAADAHLRDAAPDLLTAAERALNFLLNHQHSHGIEEGSADELQSTQMLRAAIAKAKGC